LSFDIGGAGVGGGGLHLTPKFITIFFYTKYDISLYKEIVTGYCHSSK